MERKPDKKPKIKRSGPRKKSVKSAKLLMDATANELKDTLIVVSVEINTDDKQSYALASELSETDIF